MNSDAHVVVIVLNYNGKSHLDACLGSLSKSTWSNMDVLVVDNASTDGSANLAVGRSRTRVLRCAENGGWSGGNNVGVHEALASGADYIWVLNNDVEVPVDCLARLVERMEQDPGLGIASPLIFLHGKKDAVWFAGGRVDFSRYETSHSVRVEDFDALPSAEQYISGCAMLVRSDVFRRIGLFDERFFLYFEDVDFSRRAVRAGMRLAVVDKAVLYHKNSATIQATPENPFHAYHIFRSGLLFWRKHLGWWVFHRRYCGGHLPKYLLPLRKQWQEAGRREWVQAMVDALWYFVSGARTPRLRPASPGWFTRFAVSQPWLVAELMAFHAGVLVSLVWQRAFRRAGVL